MQGFRLNLSVLTALAGTGVLLPGGVNAQSPAQLQGGYSNGVPRDYDSFQAAYYRNLGGTNNPNALPLVPPPQFSPLPSLSQEPNRYAPGKPPLTEVIPFRAAWKERPAPWVYQSRTGRYSAAVVAGSGATYYWVYWPKQPRYYYCYSPVRQHYVGAYEVGLSLYRPYNTRTKQWDEASSPPVLPPSEPPDVTARPVPAPPNMPTLPEPAPFTAAAPAERAQPQRAGP